MEVCFVGTYKKLGLDNHVDGKYFYEGSGVM